MRRYLFAFASLLCLAALPASAQQPATMRVNAGKVNLRRGPSTDSAVVRGLAKGALVTVVSHQGSWDQVQVPGQGTVGWIRSDLLEAVPAAAGGSPASTAASATPSQQSAAAPVPPPAATRAPASAVAPPPPPPPTRMAAAPKTLVSPKPAESSDDSYHGGFTIFGGLTSSSVNVTPASSGGTFGNASGFAAGIGLIAHLGGPIGLEIDADYVQGGYSVMESGITGTIHDNNIGGALLLRPAFGSGPMRIFLQGGASVGYTINCSETVTGQSSPTCKIGSTQNRTGEAVVVGAGVSYGILAVQVRYHIGLNNLDSTPGETVKSKGFLVLVSLIL